MEPTTANALLFGSTVAFFGGAASYRGNRDRLGWWGTVLGFGMLGAALSTLTFGQVIGNRPDRAWLVAIGAAGLVLSARAIQLTVVGWSRREQLPVIAATMLFVLLPVQVYPQLPILAREAMATQTAALLNVVGERPAVVLSPDGARSRVVFGNGGHLDIVRECIGIEAVGLFSGILVAARTTTRRRLAGFAFMLSAVYLVNSVRVAFTALAVSGNWFGPLLTETNTVQTSYYVAEMGVGQPLVVLATAAGYLWVSRWIPDILDLAKELFGVTDPEIDT
ncbi:MAG: archaeosortase A [Halovenus sp.]